MAGDRSIDSSTAIPRWLVVGCTATLSAALLAPFGALPAFDLGQYRLVAISIIWVHFCAGLGGIFLLAGLFIAPNVTTPRVYHPASIGLAVFGSLTAIPMIYAEFPALIALGSPQSGKGVLWFFDAAVFIALASIIRDNGRALFAVMLTAALSIGAVAVLLAYVRFSGANLLLPGGDSYAYLGALLPFLLLLCVGSEYRRSIAVLTWTAAAACVLLSDNKAAIGIFTVLTVTYFLARKRPLFPSLRSSFRFFLALGLLTAGGVALLFATLSVGFEGSFDSIDSRILIAKIMLAAQTDASLLQWLLGHGWGHTQGEFYRSLTDSGASLLDNRWDFLWRDIFHSHNIILELLYEAGLIGLLAFFALMAALIAWSPSEARVPAALFAAGYLLLNSVWFEFAHTLPLLALAVFALTRTAHSPVFKAVNARGAAIGGVATLSFVCILAFGLLLDFAHRVSPFKMGIIALSRADYPVERFPNDPRGYDFIRANVYRDVVRKIAPHFQSDGGHITPGAALGAILDDITVRLEKTRSPELLLVGLAIFNKAYYDRNRPWFKPVVAGREQLWDSLAKRHLELAPKRTDAIVVYLSFLLAGKRLPQANEMIRNILQENANDPIATYFKGVIQTQGPSQADKRRGLQTIAKAIDGGVERFLQVPDWLKTQAAEAK